MGAIVGQVEGLARGLADERGRAAEASSRAVVPLRHRQGAVCDRAKEAEVKRAMLVVTPCGIRHPAVGRALGSASQSR